MLVALARARMNRQILWAATARWGIPAAVILILLAVAERLGPEPVVPWTIALGVLAALYVAAVIASVLRFRPAEEVVAAEIDRRLELRDRITTALAFQGRDDAFAQAAVADAVRICRLPQSRERVRRLFPVSGPSDWWHAPGLSLLAAGTLLLPQLSVFAPDNEDPQQIQLAAEEVRQEVDTVVQSIEEMQALREELDDLLEEFGDAEDETRAGMKKAEDIRRDGIRKMTDLSDRLDELVRGERGKTLDILEKMTSKLNLPGEGMAREMAEAMRAGDFEAAREALDRMMEALAEGMDPEAAQAMAEAVEDIARQLEQMAQQQQALEEMLKEAGLDPAAASQGAEALEQALEQAQGLSEGQKQQIRDLAAAQAQACSMCQGLGEALKDAAQSMQGGSPGDGKSASEQLGQMEALQELIRQAQAAQGMCDNPGAGMGRGLGLAQALEQWGQGGGMGDRPGAGRGGRAELAPTPTKRMSVREQVDIAEGEMIARMLVDGVPVRGESKAKLIDVVGRAAQGVEEAINEEAIPRRYHEAIKHYFGELEARVRALPEAKETSEGGSSGDE